MGLNAFVSCRCWEEGKAAPFEFPLAVSEGRVQPAWKSSRRTVAMDAAYHRWIESCCPHPRMQYREEWIGNWYGVGAFRLALHEIDASRFPNLLGEIPSLNGGETRPPEAAKCVAELDLFLGSPPFGRQILLIEVANGKRLHRLTGDGYWFISAPIKKRLFRKPETRRVGASDRGIYVEDQDGKELFCAREVEQIAHDERTIEIRDRATGASVIVPAGIGMRDAVDASGKLIERHPKFVSVEFREDTVEEYRSLVERLRNIFLASTEVGNPVCWT